MSAALPQRGDAATARRTAPHRFDPLADLPVLGTIEVRRELYPEGIPADAYACEIVGDCLEPSVEAGDRAIASPSTPLREGRFVLLWPWEGRPSIKVLAIAPPPGWQTWRPGDVEPVVVVETTNPFRRFAVRTSTLRAVHAVLDVQLGCVNPPIRWTAARRRARGRPLLADLIGRRA